MALKLHNAVGIRIGNKEVHEIKLDNKIVWANDRFCVEYAIAARNITDTVDEMYNSQYSFYLPRIYDADDKFTFNYEKILIYKTNGEMTTNVKTLACEVSKIKLWYPKETSRISFMSYKYTSETSSDILSNCITRCYSVDTSNFTSMSSMFYNCVFLKYVYLEKCNTSKIKSIAGMFRGCRSLITLDSISNWDVSELESISNAFTACNGIVKVDLSKWNCPKLNNMYSAFNTCSNLEELHLPKGLRNIISLESAFKSCERLTTITGMEDWSCPINYISYAFSGCTSLKSLVAPNLLGEGTTAKSIYEVFLDCRSIENIDIRNWNVSKADELIGIFENCLVLESIDLSCWRPVEVNYMRRLFDTCRSLKTLDLSNWETGTIQSADYFCYDCRSLETFNAPTIPNISLLDLDYAFANCVSLKEIDLTCWNVYPSHCSLMSMLAHCTSLRKINLSNWDTTSTFSAMDMFLNVPSDVDWCYDGTNYTKFKVTEDHTGFSGTFPWNQ